MASAVGATADVGSTDMTKLEDCRDVGEELIARCPSCFTLQRLPVPQSTEEPPLKAKCILCGRVFQFE